MAEYGTREYNFEVWTEKYNETLLLHTLLHEAVQNRLDKNLIKPSEFSLIGKVLDKANEEVCTSSQHMNKYREDEDKNDV